MRGEHSVCSKHKLPVPVPGNLSPVKGVHPAAGAAQCSCSQIVKLPSVSQSSRVDGNSKDLYWKKDFNSK